MYLIIIFLPLIGSLFTGFGGRWLGYYGSSLIATSCVSLSMILSLMVFFEIGLGNTNIYLAISPWIISGILELNWSFLFDTLTAVMLVVITSISTLVHIYSISYMQEDPHFPRFMSFLEIFTFFMLILVTADNLIQMFLGWEGVGLASYLLINFWFTRLLANRSAIKALVLNRIGDFGLLFSIFSIFLIFKTVHYLTIFSMVPFFMDYYFIFFNLKIHSLSLIGIFLFIGAIGKSAQLGLHTWLPDAMEGPTPVSALIHAATMVTAGVFLIIRFSPLIEFSHITLFLLIVIGSITAFFAALTGTFQHDLKKVIAYSTCSQLGYMVFCCGLSNYNVSIFHLTNHAFFKALLFLAAGSVIHALGDEQDMRRMGSLVNFLPVTYSLMLIGSFALVGIPFLTGFYSKDTILEISNIFRNNNLVYQISSVACWLGNISVFFTAYYSFRLIYLTFLNNANYNRVAVISESSFLILIPLLILGFGSIFIGYFIKDFFIGLGTDVWNTSIFIYPNNIYFLESEFLKVSLKWLPFFLSLLGIIVSSLINIQILKIKLYKFNFFLSYFINKKWYFDSIYNKLIVFPLLNFGYHVSLKNLDRGFVELLGPFGLSMFTNKLSFIVVKLQTGQLTHYIFFIILSLCLIVNININANLYLFFYFFILLFFI